MGKARRLHLHAERLVRAVGHEVHAELAFRRLDGRVRLARRYGEAFGEQLEVVDQRFHVVLHLGAGRRSDLEVAQHHRAGILAQPLHALLDDLVRLAHFLDAHEVAVVAVAVAAERDVEVDLVVARVRLLLAQVPRDAGAAQHGARHAPRHRLLRRDDADADRALLPDAVLGEQRLVFVDAAGEVGAERIEEIEHRAFAPRVQALQLAALAPRMLAVLRHAVRQVAVDAAGAVVRGVHARARHRLVAVHQLLALAERVEEHRHRAEVERVGSDPHEVVQDARDLVEHGADVLRADRRLDAEQLLDRAHVAVLVAHHRHVIQAIHVADRLVERLRLGELLGRAMQQADVRVGTLHDFAVELEHEAQHAVGRRMLRPEIHRVVADLLHGVTFPGARPARPALAGSANRRGSCAARAHAARSTRACRRRAAARGRRSLRRFR